MSEVYRARDDKTGRIVAVKLFLEQGDASSSGRFEREAEVLAGMVHPAVVEHVAHGVEEDGMPYLAMEWLEGEDLATRLERGALRVDAAVAAIKRVAGALGAAHARGVVHRDVKPSNVFLPNHDLAKAKLIDFGIASVRGGARFTKHGEALGTPAYMAPEQARGAREIDARADVFSLGCVLFECLVGKPPFWADHPLAVMAKILLDETPPIADLCPEAPPELVALVTAMLSKEPDARPAEGRAVVEALETIGRSRSARAPHAKEPTSLTGKERQLLSVVFVARVPDAIADAIGPDESQPTIMSETSTDEVDHVYSAVLKHGGWAERLVDGTMVITLPGRGPVLDQAAQAARCALAVRAAMKRHPMVMVTGRADLSGGFPVGDVIDRGVRLLGAELTRGREREGVVIDEVTAGLLDRRFVVEVAASGLVLIAPRDAREARAESVFLGKTQPFLGRTREITRLLGLFDATVNDGSAQAVLVTAPSGMGKTRLRRELLRALDARHPSPVMLVGRGDAAHSSVALGVAANALGDLFGLREGEGREVSQHRVRARVGRNVPRAERDHIAAFLGELCGVGFPDEAHPMLVGARAERVRMGDQIRAAWEALFTAELAQGPVVFVLEDLHHADVATLTLVDAMLRTFSDAPLFVLGFARPEVDVAFPTLFAERPLLRFDLAPLAASAARALVREALGETVEPARVERIVLQADGNAFYLEEILRAVADGRGDRLPETVVAMIDARLEALEPEERRVLRAASILGSAFTESAIVHLVGADAHARVGQIVATLVERELLRERGKSTGGELELGFRSEPVREAAYATLTEEDRALGHRLAAELLESSPTLRDALVIADHLDRAGDERRAAIWYAHAAEAALLANDFPAVIERGERGAVAGASGPLLGRIRLLQSEALRHSGDNVGMEERARAARALLPSWTPPWWTATANQVLGGIRLGKSDDVTALAEQVSRSDLPDPPAAATRIAHYLHFAGRHEAAERLLATALANIGDFSLDPAKWAWGYRAYATRALLSGDHGQYLEQLELAVRAFESAGDVREAASERVNVGFAQTELGLYDEAEAVLRDALAGAERLGLRHVIGVAQENLGAVLFRKGRPDAARSLLDLAVARFREQGNRRMEGNALTYLAEVALSDGDVDTALAASTHAAELLANVPPLLPAALATKARALLASGAIEQALAAAGESVSRLESAASDEGESRARLTHAVALERAGKLEEAKEAIAVAGRRVKERAQRIRDAAWRESFLRNVEENRETIEMAERLAE